VVLYLAVGICVDSCVFGEGNHVVPPGVQRPNIISFTLNALIISILTLKRSRKSPNGDVTVVHMDSERHGCTADANTDR
jgi:hypothetical protein